MRGLVSDATLRLEGETISSVFSYNRIFMAACSIRCWRVGEIEAERLHKGWAAFGREHERGRGRGRASARVLHEDGRDR